jgi:hypothetical protein
VRFVLPRPVAGLATLALAASALLVVAAPAHAAPGDTTLTVNVVDQYGRPVAGALGVYDQSGSSQSESGTATSSTHTYTVPSGAGYSFQSIAPWSGVECFGIANCSLLSSPSGFSPVVNVPADTPTTYTVRTTVPTITGTGTVGSPLTIQIPEGLQRLNAAVATAPPPYNAYSTTNPTQWVRGTADIAGATSNPSYTTVRDDGGQSVAARLTPSAWQTAVFSMSGIVVSPLTTNAIAVAEAVPTKTKTKVNVAKRFRVGEKVTMSIRVKAKGAAAPDGKVTITIGKFKAAKKLDEDGEALFNLPRLAPGTYQVSVKYAGSEDFKKSKAKKITITVRK